MILTLCTVCAAPLSEEAVRCSACATGYCSERCERSDRRRGGHGKICGAISSGGGAEQYHADKKYKEAVAVAVEACAEDTIPPRRRDPGRAARGLEDPGVHNEDGNTSPRPPASDHV